MRIGFDAKRAYHNFTGLGNYSRTLINDLSEFFPKNEYILFNTRSSEKISFSKYANCFEQLPTGPLSRVLPSLWRSRWMLDDIKHQKIDVFHGLSHELPFGVAQSGVKSVVTMHDVIYEHYPEQYKPLDVWFYRQKYRRACKEATHIIAISEQTKKDLVELYAVSEQKITVCYQSCAPEFLNKIDERQLNLVREKYRLPSRYLLSVGSIIERKNLLRICRALQQLGCDVPLLVVGSGKGKYRDEIEQFLSDSGMQQHVRFLSDEFGGIEELPALYQMADLFLYPSVYEGFGIPVVEALSSDTLVITSHVSCLPEAGGPSAYYVDPFSVTDIASMIDKALRASTTERMERIAQGKKHVLQTFNNQVCAQAVMDVYVNM